jgi:hypothetical protein
MGKRNRGISTDGRHKHRTNSHNPNPREFTRVQIFSAEFKTGDVRHPIWCREEGKPCNRMGKTMQNEMESRAAEPRRDAKTRTALAKRPRSMLAAGAALAAVMIALGLFATEPAQARLVPSPTGFGLVDSHVPVYHLGRTYCWYESGWNGPGWYWCGYAWHRNFGWAGHGGHGWFPRPPHHGHWSKPGKPGKPGSGNPGPGNPAPGNPGPGNGGPGKPGGQPPGGPKNPRP